jgi:hypothetical protein
MTRRNPPMNRRNSDEQGMIGGIEAVLFGLLVLVGGTLMVANVWGVVDAKMAAGAAAREAARAYVKAPADSGDGPLELGVLAGESTLRSLGWPANGHPVRLIAGQFTRCSVVTFQVSVPVPLVRVPWLTSHRAGFIAVARHSEIVDPFRSGLVGTGARGSANCG